MIKHWRYHRHRTNRHIRFFLMGYPVRIEIDMKYPGHDGTRSIAQVVIETQRGTRSILWQLCRKGFSLPRHQDCDGHNHVVWFELMRARKGGRLITHGAGRSFLRGRIRTFDGAEDHEVSRVEDGRRMTLMFQYSPKDIAPSRTNG